MNWTELTDHLPPSEIESASGRTHGIAITREGKIVVFRQGKPAVLVFTPDMQLLHAWGEWLGAHGLSLVERDGETLLWLTDEVSGRVAKLSLSGELILEVPPPPEERKNGVYSPTWVAENPLTGDFWVSDGYGARFVHAHDASGKFLYTLTGEEGPGRLVAPHGLGFSPRGELWITDRTRRRIVIYSADGKYLSHHDNLCHSPCMFAFQGNKVAIPELFGSVKLFDLDLNFICEVGRNERVRPKDGWPDQTGWGWPTLAGYPDLNGTPEIRPGTYISPHCAALAPDGTLYVAEWMVGGRVTAVTPDADGSFE